MVTVALAMLMTPTLLVWSISSVPLMVLEALMVPETSMLPVASVLVMVVTVVVAGPPLWASPL